MGCLSKTVKRKKIRVFSCCMLSSLLFMSLSIDFLMASEDNPSGAPSIDVTLVQYEGHINNDYVEKLLRLALEKGGISYRLKIQNIDAEQGREINILKQTPGSVITMGTSRKYEEELHPVRIPIYRGMLGYRIGIINKYRQRDFSAVQTMDDFRKMSVGQGIGWSDKEILEAGGFEVVTADYPLLFKMVERNRFDCFLRGINEAFDEVEMYRKENPQISVERDLVLYYKFAMFFFVSRYDQALGNAIERGLKRAYKDGSFLELFNNHPQTKRTIEKAGIDNRRMYKINNPALSLETRSIPDQYWLRIQDNVPADNRADNKSEKE